MTNICQGTDVWCNHCIHHQSIAEHNTPMMLAVLSIMHIRITDCIYASSSEIYQ